MPQYLKIKKFKPLIIQMNITLQNLYISFLNHITSYVT